MDRILIVFPLKVCDWTSISKLRLETHAPYFVQSILIKLYITSRGAANGW